MAKIYYFGGRGRAEIVRLLLASGGIPYTETLFEQREEFLKVKEKGTFIFGQVPMFEIDGKHVAQTGAMTRYIARKIGIYGTTDEEKVMIDMYYEGSRDFQDLYLPIGFQDEKTVLARAKAMSTSRYLPVFNERLTTNKTGYLVGDTLTLADIGLLEPLLSTVEYFGLEILNDYPALKGFYETVTKRPNISKYLSGPLRRRKNDERYITTVKRVLDM